jgi:uncharacterized Zn-binding protein involved in type VI secretion
VRALIDLVAVCIDPATGDVPNHGPNDGAYVLPLSTRPYRDFRPALTAAAATFESSLPASIEPNAETLAWLRVGEPARHAAEQTPRVRSGESGWVVAATSEARVFVRAGSYRSRPGHIDPAHVDVWIEGKACAVDAGTFRYAAPAPWDNGLAAIEVHNTVSISGLAAARRGPRFLWLSWPRARIASASVSGDEITIAIVNESWQHDGITHHRTCTLRGGGVLVVDEIQGDPTFAAPVHVQWLLGDGTSVRMECSGQCASNEVCGDATSTRGWVAPSYGDKRPARSIRLTVIPHAGAVRVVSAFGTMRESSGIKGTRATDAEVSCST